MSVDPIPAMPTETPFERLKAVVLDDAHEMWERYAAMFALRNKSCASRESSDACADVLGEVLSASESALLKHEVCYVLGQLQSASPGARDALIRCLEDAREHPMVRHEAAEALGSIAHPSTRGYLESFASDPEPIIAESCEVALEIMRQEREGEIVTADGAVVVRQSRLSATALRRAPPRARPRAFNVHVNASLARVARARARRD